MPIEEPEELYFKIPAEVLYGGDWYIPIGDEVTDMKSAVEWLERNVESEQPETVTREHAVSPLWKDIVITDKDGVTVADRYGDRIHIDRNVLGK